MTIISSAHLAAKNSPVFKMNFAKNSNFYDHNLDRDG